MIKFFSRKIRHLLHLEKVKYNLHKIKGNSPRVVFNYFFSHRPTIIPTEIILLLLAYGILKTLFRRIFVNISPRFSIGALHALIFDVHNSRPLAMQVPSCRLWARVSHELFEFFLTPKNDSTAPFTAMASNLDLDMNFSEA